MALRAVRRSGGALVEASDEALLAATATLGAEAAVFVEPAAAAALVGLERARELGIVGPGDEVVLQLTGSGLKDTASAIRAGGRPVSVSTLDDVARALR